MRIRIRRNERERLRKASYREWAMTTFWPHPVVSADKQQLFRLHHPREKHEIAINTADRHAIEYLRRHVGQSMLVTLDWASGALHYEMRITRLDEPLMNASATATLYGTQLRNKPGEEP